MRADMLAGSLLYMSTTQADRQAGQADKQVDQQTSVQNVNLKTKYIDGGEYQREKYVGQPYVEKKTDTIQIQKYRDRAKQKEKENGKELPGEQKGKKWREAVKKQRQKYRYT